MHKIGSAIIIAIYGGIMDDNEKKEKEDVNSKTLLTKILFWLKINALLLLALVVTFWIFMCLL